MVRANLLYAMRMREVTGQPGRTRMQARPLLGLLPLLFAAAAAAALLGVG